MSPNDALMTDDLLPSYRRQWMVFFLAVALAATVYWYKTHVTHIREIPPTSPNIPMTHAFYVLRMPEVQIHADIRSSRKQMAEWIDALQKEGFHLLLLSEVLSLLNDDLPLPDKAVVLVFEPGYRRTADTYLPVFNEKKVPAVWLTNGKAIEFKDKRYISQHVAEGMKASGLWDLGYYTPEEALSLQTAGHPVVVQGHRAPWRQEAGRFALNRWAPGEPLDRLNVNPKWTAEDLVHRLLVERPVQDSKLLSLQQIQGRNWGMAVDIGATHDTRFTLRAPADKRSGSLYWLGTAGLSNVHLRMEVKSLVGEMRLLLRSDPAAGEDVSVILARGKAVIEQTRSGKAETLASVPCPDILPNTPFTAVLAVMGRQLALAVNGHPLVALDSLSEPTSSKGMIRLVVQDSLKGVGEARSVRIICTPLGKIK